MAEQQEIKRGDRLVVYDPYGKPRGEFKPFEILYLEKENDRWYVEIRELS